MKTKHVQRSRSRDSCPLCFRKETMNNTSLILYIVIQLHIQSLHLFSSCTIFSNPNKTSPLLALTHILALPKSLCSYFLPHRTFLHGQMLFFPFKTPTKSLKLQACHPALQARTEPLEQNTKTYQMYTVVKLFCFLLIDPLPSNPWWSSKFLQGLLLDR